MGRPAFNPADPSHVATLARREARERTGLFYVEGASALALSAGGIRPAVAVLADPAARSALAAAGFAAAPVHECPREALAVVSDVKIHEGAIGVYRAGRPEAEALAAAGHRRILLAEGVSDPANVAGLLRLADAFDFALLAAAGTADPFGPRAARASMGAVFRVPVGFAASGEEAARALEAAGYTLVATPCAGGAPPGTLPRGAERIALCLGGEARGLSGPLLARAAHRVTIPLAGRIQSLNVTHAAAILMHALTA